MDRIRTDSYVSTYSKILRTVSQFRGIIRNANNVLTDIFGSKLKMLLLYIKVSYLE